MITLADGLKKSWRSRQRPFAPTSNQGVISSTGPNFFSSSAIFEASPTAMIRMLSSGTYFLATRCTSSAPTAITFDLRKQPVRHPCEPRQRGFGPSLGGGNPDEPNYDDLLTVGEAAAKLRVSRDTIRRLGAPVCQCQTVAYAKQIVEAVNAREAYEPTLNAPRKLRLAESPAFREARPRMARATWRLAEEVPQLRACPTGNLGL